MIDFILSEFEKITFKACEKYASSLGEQTKNVQLVLGLNDETEVIYSLCRNYNPEKKVSFMEILGVRIDFKGYSMIVPPFIQKTLLRYAEEHSAKPKDVCVMIIPKDDKKTTMWLYVNSQPKSQIEMENLFSE
jgi:hypothetical protein